MSSVRKGRADMGLRAIVWADELAHEVARWRTVGERGYGKPVEPENYRRIHIRRDLDRGAQIFNAGFGVFDMLPMYANERERFDSVCRQYHGHGCVPITTHPGGECGPTRRVNILTILLVSLCVVWSIGNHRKVYLELTLRSLKLVVPIAIIH